MLGYNGETALPHRRQEKTSEAHCHAHETRYPVHIPRKCRTKNNRSNETDARAGHEEPPHVRLRRCTRKCRRCVSLLLNGAPAFQTNAFQQHNEKRYIPYQVGVMEIRIVIG